MPPQSSSSIYFAKRSPRADIYKFLLFWGWIELSESTLCLKGITPGLAEINSDPLFAVTKRMQKPSRDVMVRLISYYPLSGQTRTGTILPNTVSGAFEIPI